jgi:DNA-binding NtrC family response regulator
MNINTLLLVDDEQGIRKILGITLLDKGYDVSVAPNGEEALRIFKKIRPGIVITDIKMPGMDGIELLKRIKAHDTETEVIMITGHGGIELAIKSLKFEATDFVTKPINDDVLDFALKRARERITMREQMRTYTQKLEQMVSEQNSESGVRNKERMAAFWQSYEAITEKLDRGVSLTEQGMIHNNRDELEKGLNLMKTQTDELRQLRLTVV